MTYEIVLTVKSNEHDMNALKQNEFDAQLLVSLLAQGYIKVEAGEYRSL